MRKFSVIAMVVLFCGTFAFAQKAELAGGWNYVHIDEGSGGTQNGFPGGFFIDGTYYFAKIIGLTGDFEYNRKTFSSDVNFNAGDKASLLSFHAGPRVKARLGKIEPFGHALFGVTHGSFTPFGGTNFTDNAFSLKLGGGLDVAVAHHFAIRLGEFNYYLTKFGVNSPVNPAVNVPSDKQNNYAFSVGVVLR